MEIIKQIWKRFQFIGVAFVLCLILLDQIFSLLRINGVWFTLFQSTVVYILLLLLAINQKECLKENNINSLSLLLLLLFPTIGLYTNIPIRIKDLFVIFNLAIAIIIIANIYKNIDKRIFRFSIKQVGSLIIGIFIGLCIAIFKIAMGHSGLLKLAIDHPSQFIYCLLFSFSFTGEEFLFRGYLWGLLRSKKINDYWIILLTSIIWSLLQINLYMNPFELINVFVMGIILGLSTKVAKSINVCIGIRSGYNVFLLLQKLLLI